MSESVSRSLQLPASVGVVLAEGEGFEPPRLITWLFSRQLPSTTRPSLHAVPSMTVYTASISPVKISRDHAPSPPLQPRHALLGFAEHHHLDLVELVHPDHPARLPARRACLSPEGRAERRVQDGQPVRLDDLAGLHVDQRHLRRRDQIHVLPLEI